MKINPAIPRISFRYGLAGGCMAMVAFLVFHYIGIKPGSLISFLAAILVTGMFAFLPMKDFKSNVNKKEFRFYHGMTIGFISYLTIATVFSLFYLVFIEILEPNFLNEKVAYLRELQITQREAKVEEFGLEAYERQLNGLDSISLSSDVLSEFAKRLFIGIFLTPIFSVVLRTRQAG